MSHRVLTVAAVVAGVVAALAMVSLWVLVAIDRSFGYGLLAFFGVLSLILSFVPGGTYTMTIPGQGEFVLGELHDRSPLARVLLAFRLAVKTSMAVFGGLLIALALGAVSRTLLVRGMALAMVPVVVISALLRWVGRKEFAAASAAAKETVQNHAVNINIGVPKPSEKLEAAVDAEIAKEPGVHAVFILGTAAFLLLVAIVPPVASVIGDVISWPSRAVDHLFTEVINVIF